MICLDASVLVSIIFGNEGSVALSHWLAKQDRRAISDYAWGEFVATVGRKVRRGELRVKPARQTIVKVEDWLGDWRRLPVEAADIRAATAMLLTDLMLGLKLPDAVHLANAQRVGATLISTDRQQVAAARAFKIDCVNPLEEPS